YISSTRGDNIRAVNAVRRLMDQHVDGLIMMTNHPDDGRLASLLRSQKNIVLVDEDIPGVPVPRIFVDNEHGAWLAANHLIEAGDRDIALIGAAHGRRAPGERLAGFGKAV